MTGKVLIAAPVNSMLTDGLRAAGYEMIFEEKINQNKAFELIKDCVGVITSTRLQLNRELINAAPCLKWIGRMGSGMEVIDVAYAKEKGIACYGSPEGNSNAVGEHALGMLLSLTKKITWSHNEVKEGKWIRDANRGMELEGKTIGIIGYGHTGKAFAKKLSGFDVRILVYDKYNQNDIPENLVCCKDIDPIFEEAEIVSFHVPLQEDTIHYFDKAFLDKMKKPLIVINTSRGVVVDTAVLFDGLKAGKVKGACLDVIEEEPIEKMGDKVKMMLNEMITMPHVIITPHIAGYSEEALYKMSKALLGKIVTAM